MKFRVIHYIYIAIVLLSLNNFFIQDKYIYLLIFFISLFLLWRKNTVELILAVMFFGDSIAEVLASFSISYSYFVLFLSLCTLSLINVREIKLNSKIIFLFILLISTYIFSSFNISSDYGEYKLQYFLFSLLTYAGVYPFLSTKLSESDFEFNLLVFSFFSFIFFSAVFVSFGSLDYMWANFNPEVEPVGLRAISSFSSIGFGRSSGLLVLILVATMLMFNKEKEKIILLLIIISQALMLLYLTQTRQGFVALYISTLLYFFLASKNKKIVIFFIGFFVIVSSIMSVILKSNEVGRLDFNFNNRTEHWERSLDIIIQSPLVGKGVGNYVEGIWYWPHNIFLEILVELNLAFMVVFLICLIFSIINCFRLIKADDMHGPLFITISFYVFLCSQISADIARNCILFFSMLVLYLYSRRSSFSS